MQRLLQDLAFMTMGIKVNDMIWEILSVDCIGADSWRMQGVVGGREV